MQYFLGYSSFTNEPPFDPSLFVDIRERLNLEITTAISELVMAHHIDKVQPKTTTTDDEPNDDNSNQVSSGELNPVEGKFGQAKVAYGMNNILAKLKNTSESWLGSIVLVLNLVKLMREIPQDYSLSANIVLIQPRKINPTYLYYFFQSNIMEKAFTSGMKATTQAAFGIQKVRELRIELPDNKEQEQIVLIIENRLSVAGKLEENIKERLQQAEVLRQSILKKGFSGQLVR